MQKYKITVFTPTYNGAHTLERLYQSLQIQTFTDFEWLVIDDGSTDGTNVLFEKFISEKNLFPIRYYYKENGGKHTAINFGLDKSQGELFFTADSDDYITEDALEKIKKNVKPIHYTNWKTKDVLWLKFFLFAPEFCSKLRNFLGVGM